MQVADNEAMQAAFGSRGMNPGQLRSIQAPNLSTSDDGLFVQFYKHSKQDEEASREAGRPIFKSVDYVKIITPGDTTNTINTEVWDDPMNPRSHTSRFPRQWQAYKMGQSQEVIDGTPLSVLCSLAVPILTKEQIEEFKHFKVYTAEQLLAMSDAIGQRFMGINDIKRKVKIFIDAAKSSAPQEQLRSELDKRDQEITSLKNALKEQGDQLAKLLADKRK